MLAASYKNEVTVRIRFFYVSGILQKWSYSQNKLNFLVASNVLLLYVELNRIETFILRAVIFTYCKFLRWHGLVNNTEWIVLKWDYISWHSNTSIIYRQSLVKKPTSKNTSSNNTFHIFTLFTTLPTSTLANFIIEQKSIVH